MKLAPTNPTPADPSDSDSSNFERVHDKNSPLPNSKPMNLLFRFVAQNERITRTDDVIIETATTILSALQTLPGVIIYDKKTKPIRAAVNVRVWIRNDAFQNRFELTDVPRSDKIRQKALVLNIETTEHIRTIRSTLLPILKDNDAWMDVHHWSNDVTNPRIVGHLIGVEPGNCNSNQIRNDFDKRLAHHQILSDMPDFRVIQSPISIVHNNSRLSARAFAIQVKGEDYNTAIQLLNRKMYRDHKPSFIGVNMRRRNPTGYAAVINHHKKLCADTRSIALLDVTPSAAAPLFAFLKQAIPHLRSIKAASAMVPTRYNILTSSATFLRDKTAINSLIGDAWTSIKANHDGAPTPQLLLKYGEIIDDESDGTIRSIDTFWSKFTTGDPTDDLSTEMKGAVPIPTEIDTTSQPTVSTATAEMEEMRGLILVLQTQVADLTTLLYKKKKKSSSRGRSYTPKKPKATPTAPNVASIEVNDVASDDDDDDDAVSVATRGTSNSENSKRRRTQDYKPHGHKPSQQ